MATLEDKVDQLLVDMAVVKTHVTGLPALADRVSLLEAWKWRLVGACGLLIVAGVPIGAAVLQGVMAR